MTVNRQVVPSDRCMLSAVTDLVIRCEVDQVIRCGLNCCSSAVNDFGRPLWTKSFFVRCVIYLSAVDKFLCIRYGFDSLAAMEQKESAVDLLLCSLWNKKVMFVDDG